MNEKIICFHNPWEENGYLSNWYHSDFIIDGLKFSSVEKYMMFQKALVFNDIKSAEMILRIDNVEQIKNIGRQVSGYDEQVWNGLRQIVVYEGNLAKFQQNEFLKNYLLKTGETVIAECAVKDRIWGTGLSMSDNNRFDISKWKGQNLLGWTLVKVRERISLGQIETEMNV